MILFGVTTCVTFLGLARLGVKYIMLSPFDLVGGEVWNTGGDTLWTGR